MVTTLGIVEIPFAGAVGDQLSQNDAAFATRRIGGRPLLEWVVRRVTDSLLLDQVVVVFSPPQADALQMLTPADVEVFTSARPDPLGRFAETCRHFNALAAVRIRLDCPFIDPALIDRLVCKAVGNESDYIGYVAQGGRPAILSKLGLFAEWVRVAAVEQADKLATLPAERTDTLRSVYSRADQFRVRLIPIPNQLDRRDLRLTVDNDEDWEHADAIFDALGPDRLDWQTIVGMLDQQPTLRQRMAALNRADHHPAEIATPHRGRTDPAATQ